MSLSTHVLDTAIGRPARGVPVVLEARRGESWEVVARESTNDDGRMRFADDPAPGVWRIRFDTAAYFSAQGQVGFYPYVEIVFEMRDRSHHHVPLLISPFGYSTYRGS